jgi:hypothetical protein
MEQARDVGFETAVLGGGRGHAEKLFERIIVAASDLAAMRQVFKVRQAFCGELFIPGTTASSWTSREAAQLRDPS